MFTKSEDAVSPVIGTILMVAVTVLIAAAVASFVYGFGSTESKGPTASIRVEPVLETLGVMDMKIKHGGGDRLVSGDWQLSIVAAGQPPSFKVSSSDFNVGDQIVTTNMTSGTGTYNITNSYVNYNGADTVTFTRNEKYDVKIIVYPYQTMVLDKVVEMR